MIEVSAIAVNSFRSTLTETWQENRVDVTDNRRPSASASCQAEPVRQRLLESARQAFTNDDYHNVTTRRIAESAEANVSMIRYYFGSKEGLYEAVIRETLNPLFETLRADTLNRPDGFEVFLRNYYQVMRGMPGFPKLILRVLSFRQGPDYHFLLELLKRGQDKSLQLTRGTSFAETRSQEEAADIARIALISLALMPILLEETFEAQRERALDDRFFAELAAFNGRMLRFGTGVSPAD